jgi:hypothetical protein
MASADKSKVLRKRAKRNQTIYNRAIALACDKFLKTRGMTAQRENFNRSFTTENQEPKPMIHINELGPETRREVGRISRWHWRNRERQD